MTADLRFWRPRTVTPGGVPLRFSAGPTDVYGAVTAPLPAAQAPALTLVAECDSYVRVAGSLAAALPEAALSLPALTCAASGTLLQASTMSANLPPAIAPALTVSVSATYDSALPDAIGPHCLTRMQPALPVITALASSQQHMRQAMTPAAADHSHAAPRCAGYKIDHQEMLSAARASHLRHQHSASVAGSVRARHAEHVRAHRTLAMTHQHGTALGGTTAARHAEYIRLRRRLSTPHQHGLRATRGARIHGQSASPTAVRLRVPHQQAIPLPVGMWHPPVGPVAPPATYSSPVHLLFCCLNDGSTRLRFGDCSVRPGNAVPILEYYLVINTFSLVRADTGEPVEVSDFSASLDVDSWCWGWSASLHAALMPLVRSPTLGEHVELIASINGTLLRLVVERMGRDRRFGNSQLKISGRGRAAWLADPHAPVATRYNTAARSAQQLLDDALTINGVSIGWTLDWRITDWLVPAGAWSHTGTYMDAATRIAEAGGAYVQAHNTDQQLIILPRYPAAPWDWASLVPDIDLPEDVCELEGIEWQDKPGYNAVYVVGGDGGRRDRIRRTSTAADRMAQTIVDGLATAPEMTRQRGLAALGDTGRQAHITLRLPVLPETGIIQPGRLIRYTESGTQRLGLSRSVQVEQRFPALWQTIRLETHE